MEKRSQLMWKTPLPLSDVLRMLELIKQIDIAHYGQEEYREIVNEISLMFISTDNNGDE
jgi:ABC-type uncharacterized transport system ATPase subunit